MTDFVLKDFDSDAWACRPRNLGNRLRRSHWSFLAYAAVEIALLALPVALFWGAGILAFTFTGCFWAWLFAALVGLAAGVKPGIFLAGKVKRCLERCYVKHVRKRLLRRAPKHTESLLAHIFMGWPSAQMSLPDIIRLGLVLLPGALLTTFMVGVAWINIPTDGDLLGKIIGCAFIGVFGVAGGLFLGMAAACPFTPDPNECDC